jgi:hypothetical protein
MTFVSSATLVFERDLQELSERYEGTVMTSLKHIAVGVALVGGIAGGAAEAYAQPAHMRGGGHAIHGGYSRGGFGYARGYGWGGGWGLFAPAALAVGTIGLLAAAATNDYAYPPGSYGYDMGAYPVGAGYWGPYYAPYSAPVVYATYGDPAGEGYYYTGRVFPRAYRGPRVVYTHRVVHAHRVVHR